MKREKFNLKGEYKKSWKYIKVTRNFIYTVIGIFFLFALFGFFIPAPEFLEQQILELIRGLLEKTAGMSATELIGFIFFNNLKSSFFGMIFGVLIGIFPMISVVSNGYLLGFVGAFSVELGGLSVLLRLLPHGIFELSAVFISLGMGIKLGTIIFRKNYKKVFRDYFLNSLKVFLLVVIPLLVIAAIIEGILISFF